MQQICRDKVGCTDDEGKKMKFVVKMLATSGKNFLIWMGGQVGGGGRIFGK